MSLFPSAASPLIPCTPFVIRLILLGAARYTEDTTAALLMALTLLPILGFGRYGWCLVLARCRRAFAGEGVLGFGDGLCQYL